MGIQLNGRVLRIIASEESDAVLFESAVGRLAGRAVMQVLAHSYTSFNAIGTNVATFVVPSVFPFEMVRIAAPLVV